MFRLLSKAVLASVALSGFAFHPLPISAQRMPGELAHTDFSGRWRMAKDDSDFAGFHAPDVVVRIVDQHNPNMNIHTIQTTGTQTTLSDIIYSTDGATTTNVINGRQAESKAFWDGPTLVVRTNMKNAKGEDESIIDRWDLSPDKTKLTISSHVELGDHQADMKMVCVREKTGS
jgi:hypothetical protein